MLQGFPGPLRMQWVQEDVLGRAVPFEVSAVSSPSSPSSAVFPHRPCQNLPSWGSVSDTHSVTCLVYSEDGEYITVLVTVTLRLLCGCGIKGGKQGSQAPKASVLPEGLWKPRWLGPTPRFLDSAGQV